MTDEQLYEFHRSAYAWADKEAENNQRMIDKLFRRKFAEFVARECCVIFERGGDVAKIKQAFGVAA